MNRIDILKARANKRLQGQFRAMRAKGATDEDIDAAAPAMMADIARQMGLPDADKYGQPAPAQPEPEEPADEAAPPDVSHLESLGRGAAQGASLGFADELAGVGSAIGDWLGRKVGGGIETGQSMGDVYREGRDESRAAYKAAQTAHPYVYGGGEIGGAIASGLIPGAGAGKLGLTGAKAAAGLGALEGAVQSVGASEAEGAKELLGDAVRGGVLGGALGGVAHAAFGRYANSAVKRHAEHIADEVLGNAPSAFKKRFASIQQLAPDVFDNDPALRKAVNSASDEGLEAVNSRLTQYTGTTQPRYNAIDTVSKPDTIGDVRRVFDAEIYRAEREAGKKKWANILEKVRDDATDAWSKDIPGLAQMSPVARQAAIEAKAVPTYGMRKWVTNLLTEADETMGTIAETERWKLKDRLHDLADDVLKQRLSRAAAQSPQATPIVQSLARDNRTIAVLAKAKDALQARVNKDITGPKSLTRTLGQYAPWLAGAAMAGDSVVSGGLALGAGKAAIWGAGKLNKAATTALSRLEKRVVAGDVSAADIMRALQMGVPLSAVQAVLPGTSRPKPPQPETEEQP